MPNGHDNELGAILARMDEKLRRVSDDVAEVKQGVVTRSEFEPIKQLVFGLVGLVLLGVVGAIVQLVLK